jgi:hypothetical protein
MARTKQVNRCQCTKKDGEQCTRNAFRDVKENKQYNFCKQHQRLGCGGNSKTYDHPSFKSMITRAIYAASKTETRGAVSVPFIKKYLETNWRIDPKNYLINVTVRKMFDAGEIYKDRVKKGSYHLSKELNTKMEKQENKDK